MERREKKRSTRGRVCVARGVIGNACLSVTLSQSAQNSQKWCDGCFTDFVNSRELRYLATENETMQLYVSNIRSIRFSLTAHLFCRLQLVASVFVGFNCTGTRRTTG